jgi:hypothetical protein
MKEPAPAFILQDRVLLAALLFGSSGYIVIGSWAGAALLVAGFMTGCVWAFRTAASHPQRGLRLLATLLLVVLGTFMTVYIAAHQGLVQ